eukprot:30426-Pelagococcus_subviridis.AAC.5
MRRRDRADGGVDIHSRLGGLQVRLHVPAVPQPRLRERGHAPARHDAADHRDVREHAFRVLRLSLR